MTKEDRLGCCFAPDGWSVVAKGLATRRPESTASAWQRITTGRPLGFKVTVRPRARRYRTCAAGCVSGAHKSATSVSDRYIIVSPLFGVAEFARKGPTQRHNERMGKLPRKREPVLEELPASLSWVCDGRPDGDRDVFA